MIDAVVLCCNNNYADVLNKQLVNTVIKSTFPWLPKYAINF